MTVRFLLYPQKNLSFAGILFAGRLPASLKEVQHVRRVLAGHLTV